MPGPLIADVSDTARWLAAYRTQESARPDALFADPLAGLFAARLAATMARAPSQLRNGWPIVVRTKLIDELVLASVADGCDCVVNLAAGLDTRPYRLALPASVTWVEADLPAVIDEKERVLAGQRAACRVARHRIDLEDATARADFLEDITGPAGRPLVITEGVLVYLDAAVVDALARELLARTTVHWWILDVASPGIVDVIRRGMAEHIANAPLRFAPADGVAFFESRGWRARDVRSLLPEAIRLRRVPFFLPPAPLRPDVDPRRPGAHRWSGVVRLERGHP